MEGFFDFAAATDEEFAQEDKDEYGVVYDNFGKKLLWCSNKELTRYTVKEDTKIICNGAFRDCVNLISIKLHNNVKVIGENAFLGCTSLTSVKLPKWECKIGHHAFANCTSLVSATLPAWNYYLGTEIFLGCSKLTDIISHCQRPHELYSYVFVGIDKENCTLHVPAGCIMAYQMTEGWNEFHKIEESPEEVEVEHLEMDEAFKKFTETMVERIERMLEKSDSNWKQPWFSNYMPMNLNKKYYKGTNLTMLMLFCSNLGYEYPVFGTAKAYERLNKKGTPEENRVRILKDEKPFPVIYSTPVAINLKTGAMIPWVFYDSMPPEAKKGFILSFKSTFYKVYNIVQTNLEQARPKRWKRLTERKESKIMIEVYPPLDKIIREQTWLCPIKEEPQDEAYYSRGEDEIVLPMRKTFSDGESFSLTALHEMAHSTGGRGRIKRPHGAWGTKEYAREELVAELTAAVVGASHGMQKHLKEGSVRYLKNWLEDLKEEDGYLKTVLADVNKASRKIEEFIKKNEEKKGKPKDAEAVDSK